MKQRLLSLLLCGAMLFSMCTPVSAAENQPMPLAAGDVEYRDCDADGQNWTTGTKASGDYTPVTAETTTWDNGWYVASGSVTIEIRVTVSGDVHLILTDGCNLTINGGINTGDSHSLTIYGQQNGTGKLTATGGGNQAGIGGSDRYEAGGTVTINGGTVNANGGLYGAGIGGGDSGAGGTVTINNGNVTVTGGSWGAAGIGGGNYGGGGTVTIRGGTIQATGGIIETTRERGPGIGAGVGGWGGTVTITGGTLKNTRSSGGSFTMTGGTLDDCTIENSPVSVNSAVIQKSTINNITTWTDANITAESSSLSFSSEATLTKGGTGNTYKGAVTITGDAEFGGNTTFNGSVTISGNNASFADSTTFKGAVTIEGDNVRFSENTTFSSTVDIAANKNVTLAGSTTLTGNVTVGAGGSLTNSGTLAVPRDCTITNHGTITNAEGAVINLSGTIDNKTGTAGSIANNGTIFLVGSGQVIDIENVTGYAPVPAGEVVIDLSTVASVVTIGPDSYTIGGVSHTYDPAQNSIVLTGTYGGNVSGTWQNHAAAVTVLENTTASIILRDVNIGWESGSYCSSIWVKDYCTVTVFLEGTNTLKPRNYGNGIGTMEHTTLAVEGDGTLNLDMSNGDTIVGIGQCSNAGWTGKFGSITVNGGNITTEIGSSVTWVAGIGGYHGTITVNGGTITGDRLLGGTNMLPSADYAMVINGGTIDIVDEKTRNPFCADPLCGAGGL